jgi:hypothetical protein
LRKAIAYVHGDASAGWVVMVGEYPTVRTSTWLWQTRGRQSRRPPRAAVAGGCANSNYYCAGCRLCSDVSAPARRDAAPVNSSPARDRVRRGNRLGLSNVRSDTAFLSHTVRSGQPQGGRNVRARTSRRKAVHGASCANSARPTSYLWCAFGCRTSVLLSASSGIPGTRNGSGQITSRATTNPSPSRAP